MSAHETCGRLGKFDCTADEVVYDRTMDEGIGDGDVEATSMWWSSLDLTEAEDEQLAEHYGARYIIARENSAGTFWVEVYATTEAREERLNVLEEAYRAWYSDAVRGEEESWEPR